MILRLKFKAFRLGSLRQLSHLQKAEKSTSICSNSRSPLPFLSVAMLLHRSCSVLTLLLIFSIATSDGQVPTSPSPAPENAADAPFSPSSSPQLVGAPASSPLSSFPSPPAPVPDLSLGSTPPLSPHIPSESPVPSPSPSESDYVSRNGKDLNSTGAPQESSGGMSSGKKFGIAFAVIVLAGLAIFAALVYKKRQENIRRARYNYVAGANIL